MYLVKYKTASSCNELHDIVHYYADPEDAFNTGLFCEKIVVWVELFDVGWYDMYNKHFRIPTDQEIDMFAV